MRLGKTRAAERAYMADPCDENLERLDRCTGGSIKREGVLWLLRGIARDARWRSELAQRIAREARRCQSESHPLAHVFGPAACTRVATTEAGGVRLCRGCADELADYVMRDTTGRTIAEGNAVRWSL